MVISDIWPTLPGQNRGPYIRNPVYSYYLRSCSMTKLNKSLESSLIGFLTINNTTTAWSRKWLERFMSYDCIVMIRTAIRVLKLFLIEARINVHALKRYIVPSLSLITHRPFCTNLCYPSPARTPGLTSNPPSSVLLPFATSRQVSREWPSKKWGWNCSWHGVANQRHCRPGEAHSQLHEVR